MFDVIVFVYHVHTSDRNWSFCEPIKFFDVDQYKISWLYVATLYLVYVHIVNENII